MADPIKWRRSIQLSRAADIDPRRFGLEAEGAAFLVALIKDTAIKKARTMAGLVLDVWMGLTFPRRKV